MGDQQLPGMPPPWPLTVTRTDDGRTVAVRAGPMLLSAFGAADLEMRDLVDLLADRGQPLPGQDRRRRVRPPALPGVADPVPLPRARRPGAGAPDGPPADPQHRPAAAGPPAGGPGPDPRRDRPQAGRVPVPDHRADQAARHAARPRLPVRRHRRGHRGQRHGRTGPAGPATARTPPTDSTPAPPAATATVPAMAPHPDSTPGSRPAGMPAPDRKPAEAPMAGPPLRPLRPTPTTTGTPRVRARPGGWRRGSRPGLSPAAMPGRCWCTPLPTGSAPGPC